jgi:hypothetical protein
VAIDAVVRTEKLCAGRYRGFVSLMRIAELQRLSADRKTCAKILRMIDDAKTVASI